VEITEVRIKLMEEDAGERLKAFCSITFDDSFVIRDLKIIEGANGPFVAMPSRKLTSHCPNCGSKNHLRAMYCNQCGRRLSDNRIAKDEEGRAKLYADIAHPINSECREQIQQHVVREFRSEVERSKQSGYVSRYDDLDLDSGGGGGAGPSAATIAAKAETPATRVELPSASQPQIQAQIQGPEHEPRPPHRLPSQKQVATPEPDSSMDGAPRSDFGAGIFEP
jgi:stage V sporulation protein G